MYSLSLAQRRPCSHFKLTVLPKAVWGGTLGVAPAGWGGLRVAATFFLLLGAAAVDVEASTSGCCTSSCMQHEQCTTRVNTAITNLGGNT